MTEIERFPEVMLLAAGLGTRMRPLTDATPKPLIPVAGTPLIDRVITAAVTEGARRFVINAHAHADQVVAHFAGHPRVTVLREETLLGVGGGLRNGLSALTGDTLLVMNTDAFWLPEADRPLARLIARHREIGAAMTMLCVQPGRAVGARLSHDFCLDPVGRITPDSGAPVIYTGVMVVERALVQTLPEGKGPMAPLIAAAEAKDGLRGVHLLAPWFHVGDPEGLAEAEARLGAA
ncbi:MobA-like NTP transferase domain-containing protein [Devosia enhydra]|uniref:MobA-like NTP transferase domain-containing protein n=1 Tax=Devosia enhydra TaxID=665118 RepID=A0A1K2HX66_9HYPH|nr:nucleotidyltransferase family protein [Devosia enhydra]SFZ84180.1 MobA-like NTP transferase domain-containing protein [Devosia enhydra]